MPVSSTRPLQPCHVISYRPMGWRDKSLSSIVHPPASPSHTHFPKGDYLLQKIIMLNYYCFLLLRVSLVVTETVDAGLLGEWIIPSLRHAWAELLLPRQQGEPTNQRETGGHVIPCGARVYVTLIECPEIRKQSR